MPNDYDDFFSGLDGTKEGIVRKSAEEEEKDRLEEIKDVHIKGYYLENQASKKWAIAAIAFGVLILVLSILLVVKIIPSLRKEAINGITTDMETFIHGKTLSELTEITFYVINKGSKDVAGSTIWELNGNTISEGSSSVKLDTESISFGSNHLIARNGNDEVEFVIELSRSSYTEDDLQTLAALSFRFPNNFYAAETKFKNVDSDIISEYAKNLSSTKRYSNGTFLTSQKLGEITLLTEETTGYNLQVGHGMGLPLEFNTSRKIEVSGNWDNVIQAKLVIPLNFGTESRINLFRFYDNKVELIDQSKYFYSNSEVRIEISGNGLYVVKGNNVDLDSLNLDYSITVLKITNDSYIPRDIPEEVVEDLGDIEETEEIEEASDVEEVGVEEAREVGETGEVGDIEDAGVEEVEIPENTPETLDEEAGLIEEGEQGEVGKPNIVDFVPTRPDGADIGIPLESISIYDTGIDNLVDKLVSDATEKSTFPIEIKGSAYGYETFDKNILEGLQVVIDNCPYSNWDNRYIVIVDFRDVRYELIKSTLVYLSSILNINNDAYLIVFTNTVSGLRSFAEWNDHVKIIELSDPSEMSDKDLFLINSRLSYRQNTNISSSVDKTDIYSTSIEDSHLIADSGFNIDRDVLKEKPQYSSMLNGGNTYGFVMMAKLVYLEKLKVGMINNTSYVYKNVEPDFNSNGERIPNDFVDNLNLSNRSASNISSSRLDEILNKGLSSLRQFDRASVDNLALSFVNMTKENLLRPSSVRQDGSYDYLVYRICSQLENGVPVIASINNEVGSTFILITAMYQDNLFTNKYYMEYYNPFEPEFIQTGELIFYRDLDESNKIGYRSDFWTETYGNVYEDLAIINVEQVYDEYGMAYSSKFIDN